jgi:uncharacterized membrane protein YccF (DUF307 family)
VSLIGNIIWLIFGGFLAALGYMLGGLALCVTIIGIPFGLPALSLGVQTLLPFGKTLTQREAGGGILALIFNILWLLIFGWSIALVHLTFGVILAITIVGIPFAQQHFKLLPVALLPFSYKLE